MRSLDALIRGLKPSLSSSLHNVVLIRAAQSMGSHAGSLVGWTDSRLTVKGREQANQLYKQLYQHLGKFGGVYSSDLSRCFDTAEIALGFPATGVIVRDKLLREINFGDQQGKHFDSLSTQQKQRVNSTSYKAPGGQSWNDVSVRMNQFMKALPPGQLHLVFTHGGPICMQTYNFGEQDIPPHCSATCLEVNAKTGSPQKILFRWNRSMTEQI